MQGPVAGCGNRNGELGWWALGEKRSGKAMEHGIGGWVPPCGAGREVHPGKGRGGGGVIRGTERVLLDMALGWSARAQA